MLSAALVIVGLIILYVIHDKIFGDATEGFFGCTGTAISITALFVIAAGWPPYLSGGLIFIAFIFWATACHAHATRKNESEKKQLKQKASNSLTPEEKKQQDEWWLKRQEENKRAAEERLKRDQAEENKRAAEERLKLEEKRNRQAEEQLKLEEESKREAKEQLEREKLLKFQKQITAQILVLDSNIWMNGESNSNAFFETLASICQEEQRTILMYGDQYDEICNIKKRRSEDETAARRAISRIDNFKEKGLVKIEDMKPDARPRAYADPVIVMRLTSQAKNGASCTLITNDTELRTRVRQLLEDSSASDWHVAGLEEFQKGCDAYIEFLKTR